MSLQFRNLIDFPIAIASCLLLLLIFERWANNPSTELSVDLRARLPKARIKTICLFMVLVSACWLSGVAFWTLIAIVGALGALAFMTGGVTGAIGPLFLVVYGIREWAFDFPMFILQPQQAQSQDAQIQRLVGTTCLVSATLRPLGEIKVGNQAYQAMSIDGSYVDVGTKVTVTAIRNGMAITKTDDSTEAVS